ncbi:MAG: outer membrane protein assembly factor BamC [Sideroxydans sp.]|nr:outer membrane protein assembly factor BamC [Sideroxydans sp.]NOT99085.1 outer membrane protein assembly factor BamC [Sideroxydans sp.]
MKKSNIVMGLMAVSLLAGCGVFDRKQTDYKAGAAPAAALEVPPELSSPVTEQRFAIPADEGKQVAKYSEFAREKVPEPCALPASAPVAVSAAVVVSAPKLLEVGGLHFMLMDEAFDKSWRNVGLALEKAGLAVADRDRSKGIYFLKPAAKAKKGDELQVFVHETSGVTDVTVKEGNDLSSNEALRVLNALFQSVSK